MPNIIQLSSHIADLIAAGEVVERPASVVKELLENAIDAGAKNVTIEIQNGGMTFIRILDDGCGMEPQDAKTAFLRHATSKIRQKEDLERIHTLGFRGEALAATAAVSKIDLLTRTADSDEGVRLHLEAGNVLTCEPAGCPVGTTMIVRDLFYNTPARMKFMKRDSVEASAVFAAVQKQALAHPETAIRFLKDGEELLHTAGDGALQSAIYAVLGRQAAMEMVPVDSQWEKIRISGYTSVPTATRGTRNYQSFFVNGRYVKSRMMNTALEEAYRNQIMAGRFPSCVLCVTLPVNAVDVNVHPAKTEVKFLNEREIFDCIHYGVLAALNKTPARVELKLPQKRAEQPPASAPEKKPLPDYPQKQKQPFFRTMNADEYRRFSEVLAQPQAKPSAAAVAAVFDKKQEPMIRSDVLPLQPSPEKPKPEQEQKPEPKPEPEQTALPMQENDLYVVGEVLDTYIIVEQKDTVIFIDKHAAHERILFEKLKKHEQSIMGQMLLTPLTCTLDREEAAAILENRALLLTLGYDADDLGDGTVLLRQIPSEIDEADAEASLSELAGHLLCGKQDTPDTVRNKLLHSIACKAAIKAGYHTGPRERDALVREVLSREDLKYCPHGRPICVTLTRRQLEKQFKRV